MQDNIKRGSWLPLVMYSAVWIWFKYALCSCSGILTPSWTVCSVTFETHRTSAAIMRPLWDLNPLTKGSHYGSFTFTCAKQGPDTASAVWALIVNSSRDQWDLDLVIFISTHSLTPLWNVIINRGKTRTTRLPVFWSRQRGQTTFHGGVGRGDESLRGKSLDGVCA